MDTFTLRLFEKTRGNYEIRCLSDDTLLSQNPLPTDELTAFIKRTEREYSGPVLAAERLGQDLYAWLERVTGGCLSRMRGRSQAFCLRIDASAGLRHLPWELLHDGEVFLCAPPRRPFTPARRVTDFRRNETDRANRPLRVLFMASSPEKVEPALQFEIEEARILEKTRDQGLELVVEESGSLDGLRRVIADYPEGHFDVVHLTGHADIIKNRPGFWLEDDVGAPEFADADALADAFGLRFPRLLFLSGCRSGQCPAGGDIPSLAEALVDAGAPAVLGWALPVGDSGATLAAAELYGRLADGDDLDAALARLRPALLKSAPRYWHLLRLYTNATPPTAHVTPRNTPGREKRKRREAAQAFLNAASGERIPVCGRAQFVGRRRLLQRALKILKADMDEPGGSPGLLLRGMGGLGKSSLAARICDRLSPTHDHWVWYGGVDETELRRVITDKLANPKATEALNDPELNFFQQIRNVLEQHMDRPAIFVFDDFEHNARILQDRGPKQRPVPRTGENGALVLKDEARAPLEALLKAISETGSESRALITCRHGADLPVTELGLDSLRGADLDKKADALEAFAETSKVPPEFRKRAMELASGNPRLMEWLDKILRDAGTDHAALLDRLAERTAEFREDVLLKALLEGLRTPVLRALSLLALYRLPVPMAAVTALTDDPEVAAHLKRLSALGLVEHIVVGVGVAEDPMPDHYFASPLLDDLLAGELDASEIREARQNAARTLKRLWWDSGSGSAESQGLEIRRLALDGGEMEIAVDITHRMAWHAMNQNRFREAQGWCWEVLALAEDWRLLTALGRAEKILGHSEAETHYRRALALAPAISDRISERDLSDYSALLYNYAELRLQCGFVSEALQLWNDSLQLDEKIGDVKGKAATLHNMAGVIAQQGDVQKALQLWNDSLQQYEKIGDVKGKAATLANMAWLAGGQGDTEQAVNLNRQALAALVQIGAWLDAVTVLDNLSDYLDEKGMLDCLTQALWITLRIHVPLNGALNLCGQLLRKTGGMEAEHAPLFVGAMIFFLRSRGENHPQKDELAGQIAGALHACARARGISDEKIPEWLEAEGLMDPNRLLPALSAHLETWIAEWYFDPSIFR